MKQHPLSAAFPAMPADEYQSLVDSITVNGVLNPITTFEGMVLDGWHRFKAAEQAGMQCPMVELDGTDPQAFVIAQNKDRRHITQSQIALAAAAVYQWKPAHREKVAPGATLSKTNAELAEIAGTSERTIRQAKAVELKAAPKVKEAVKSGEISLKRAAEIAQMPPKEQVKAIKSPKPQVEDVQYVGPSQAEIDDAMASAKEDLSTLHKLLEADDKLAVLVAENDQLRAELAVVKLARDGYMNRSNELISRVKWLKNKLAKVEASA